MGILPLSLCLEGQCQLRREVKSKGTMASGLVVETAPPPHSALAWWSTGTQPCEERPGSLPHLLPIRNPHSLVIDE